MKLNAIAEILPGFAFREAIQADEKGDILVLQAKDIFPGEFITDVSNLIRTSQALSTSTGYLQRGDVVLVARGMKTSIFKATVFMSEENNVVASSSLHIIRVISPKVIPEYLSIFLNTWAGQNAISQILTGSYVSAVPKRELGNMHIALPPLQDQEILVALHQNLLERIQILFQKKQLSEEIFNATFTKLTQHLYE